MLRQKKKTMQCIFKIVFGGGLLFQSRRKEILENKENRYEKYEQLPSNIIQYLSDSLSISAELGKSSFGLR